MGDVAVLALLAMLLQAVLGSTHASADPFHHQALPLGQRALGMGGAFTGLANDPSAAYYNPAGLALTTDGALSASLTVNAFDRRTVSRGYRTRIKQSSLKHDSQPTLPVFVTIAKKIGRRSKDKKRNHTVALTTFTADQSRLTFDVEQRGAPGGVELADTFSASREDSTTWNGLSYAYRMSDRLAFGVSAFLSVTRTRYQQEHIAVTLGALDRSRGSYENRGSVWESYLTRTEVRNLLARFGVLYETPQRLRVGLMLQPPSLHVRGTASVRARYLTSDPGGTAGGSEFLNASESGLTSHHPIPWEVRLGASYMPLDWVTIAMDARLHGGNGTQSDPVVEVGPRSVNPETGAVPRVGDLTLETWYRHPTANLAIGAEAVIDEKISLRAGLFTSHSAAPAVPQRSATYAPPDVNLYGGAFSVGYVGGGYDLSLGVAGMVGWGDALAYDLDAPPESAYVRTDVFDRSLFLFLSGAKNAATKLASTADQKLQEIRRENAAEERRRAGRR